MVVLIDFAHVFCERGSPAIAERSADKLYSIDMTFPGPCNYTVSGVAAGEEALPESKGGTIMPTFSRCATRRHAFTLIELLVVIAIIAILAAILFPVFAKAREKARQTACLSNNKQLSLAIMQYTQDNDELLPSMWGGDQGTGQYGVSWVPNGKPCPGTATVGKLGGWTYYCDYQIDMGGVHITTYDPSQGTIYPYMKNSQIEKCPSDPSIQLNSYEFNGALTHRDPDSLMDITIGLPQFREPSDTIVLTEDSDSDCGGANDGALYPPWSTQLNAPVTNGDMLGIHHNGGSNAVFADGHAKWYLPNMVPSLLEVNGAWDLSAHEGVSPRWEP
jgi:prepilin-type N-terminal cleavage/methylation domain-containing protein/prepilin-type processing-associated H-X9-DG protein